MIQEDWYTSIVEDCKAIITEKIYLHRMELIELKHLIGERICSDSTFKKLSGSRSATLKKLFEDIGIGRADGYACVAFYEKYPKLSAGVDSFKEQKNISWDKIKRTYLPVKHGKEEVCLHSNIIKICNDCKIRIK
jgi:hypothetical protein